MSDPLVHVGPSADYLRGYNDAVAGRSDGTDWPDDTCAFSEYDEGYLDGCADVATGIVLAGTLLH